LRAQSVAIEPLSPSLAHTRAEYAVRPRPNPRAKAVRRPRKTDDDEMIRPAVGTLSRTNTLLLAALKVWELKNGFRD
jgi:hypothetical protein